MALIRDQFILDPEIIYLNHGSFGACPRPVFETYQAWQRELERQPVEFLGRRFTEWMAQARGSLAAYLGVNAEDVVYFSNPTTAINMVARNLPLHPGDEILTTDHEYGAMDRTWRFLCRLNGAGYIQHPVPLPVATQAEFVDRFWARVNKHTRVIFLSHITSATALIFPVAEICRLARQAGILTVIDGAHAPGQIPLDLGSLGADLYTGACHKWLCAPKGAAFLFARPEIQTLLKPLVISWGYESETPGPSQFVDYHEWQGTRDPSAFLAVPTAIEFQRQNHWEAVRQECHALAVETRSRINALTGLEPVCPDPQEEATDAAWFSQMFIARLPDTTDLASLKAQMYDQDHIEVPLIQWNAQKFIRVSIQGYNTRVDTDALVEALANRLFQKG